MHPQGKVGASSGYRSQHRKAVMSRKPPLSALAILMVVASCAGPTLVMAETASPDVHQPSGATVCSMAPKIEWWVSSSISIRTVSPCLRKGVSALPRRMVSTVRTSAMQE